MTANVKTMLNVLPTLVTARVRLVGKDNTVINHVIMVTMATSVNNNVNVKMAPIVTLLLATVHAHPDIMDRCA